MRSGAFGAPRPATARRARDRRPGHRPGAPQLFGSPPDPADAKLLEDVPAACAAVSAS